MPEMDGVEALKEIRAKYSTKVVVVSSVAQMGSSRAAEVIAHLSKWTYAEEV